MLVGGYKELVVELKPPPLSPIFSSLFFNFTLEREREERGERREREEREGEMGNCQAIDAATLVVQHPSGKEEKFYGEVSASEIMKMNPGHYVALLISTTLCPSNPTTDTGGDRKDKNSNPNDNKNTASSVRVTRIKLLRPTESLVLGKVYRLIANQEVMKGLWAKKQAKVKRSNNHQVEGEQPLVERVMREKQVLTSGRRSETSELLEKDIQVNNKPERGGYRPRTATTSRTWQPSLHSISEAAS